MTGAWTEPWAALALLAVGAASAFVNTLAGGGSLLTLPVLMLLGLPADLANATNRVSILGQTVMGAAGFDRGGRMDREAILSLLIPTAGGALAGSWIAAHTPAAILRPVLIGTLLGVAALMLWSPGTLTPAEGEAPLRLRDRPAAALWLAGVGLYGGFVQAGAGILMLSALCGALRYDLVRANALKAVIMAGYTAVALAVFVAKGQVVWVPALVLTAGTLVGARLAVGFAMTRGQETLRRVVFAIVVLACAAALFK